MQRLGHHPNFGVGSAVEAGAGRSVRDPHRIRRPGAGRTPRDRRPVNHDESGAPRVGHLPRDEVRGEAFDHRGDRRGGCIGGNDLGVGMLDRRTCAAAVIQEDCGVRPPGVEVEAGAVSQRGEHFDGLVEIELAEAGFVIGREDHHFVRAGGVAVLGRPDDGVQVGHDPDSPAERLCRTLTGPVGLGRRAIFMAGTEGTLLGPGACIGVGRGGVRSRRAFGRDDHASIQDLVMAVLGHRSRLRGRSRSWPFGPGRSGHGRAVSAGTG